MDIKGDPCLSCNLLPALALYLTQQNWKCLNYHSWQCTVFHNSDQEIPKIKVYSVRALKRYLNEKNLIHSRVTERTSNLVHRFFKHTSTHEGQLSVSKKFQKSWSQNQNYAMLYATSRKKLN